MTRGRERLTSWHTRQERSVIRRLGGRPHLGYGYDGLVRGRPVEVRSQRKDNRYRIQRNVHFSLVRRRGYYIFVTPKGGSRMVGAMAVSKLISRKGRRWYRDRLYPHTFVYRREVFGGLFKRRRKA